MEADQIDGFSATVFRDFKKVKNTKKPGRLGQRRCDIHETYRLDGVDLYLSLIVHTIAAADLDVGTQPEPDGAGNFPVADSVAQSFRENHRESLRFSQIRHRICVKLSGSQEAFHTMVLSKEELTSALQTEVRILVHLAGKIDPKMLDYRPTPKQRSTIELLQYLSIMGPMLLRGIKAGAFDGAAWGAANA